MADSTVLLGRTLVLVAHPDDESVGCGALLQRIEQPVVVFATDGAPRDEFFWGKTGSRLRYARVRREEAEAALSPAGIVELIFLAENDGLGERFVDQELHRAIPEAVDKVAGIVTRYRPQALLTTAYEGGHPDHDVCSFLAAVLGQRYGLPVWEFPLYHRSAEQISFQRFLVRDQREEADHGISRLEISAEALEVKRRMVNAYASQHPFLLEFDPAVECFRPQPRYDYSQPPHAGTLNYEAWHWPMTGPELCAVFCRFMEGQRRTAI